jgi:acyl-CoA thioester hydrolase
MAETADRKPERAPPATRADFAVFLPMSTRWRDNDAYGHLNNLVYLEFFDAAVNQLLIERGLLDQAKSEIVGFIAESRCRYHSQLSYPDSVEVGLAVAHLGRSSVTYRLAVFKAGAPVASADGGYTHVYVNRATGKSVPIPDGHRRAMESWRVTSDPSLS